MTTSRERQAAFKTRMREKGFVQVADWVPASERQRYREIAKRLREGLPVEDVSVVTEDEKASVVTERPKSRFDEHVADFMAELPKTQRKKFGERLQRLIQLLGWEVDSAITKGIQDKHPEELRRIKELTEQAETDRERAKVWLQGISPVMTMDDFNFVRGCLHPDKHPADRLRFNKAFDIFNRLKDTVNPHTPLKVLRERGWEKMSSRYRG